MELWGNCRPSKWKMTLYALPRERWHSSNNSIWVNVTANCRKRLIIGQWRKIKSGACYYLVYVNIWCQLACYAWLTPALLLWVAVEKRHKPESGSCHRDLEGGCPWCIGVSLSWLHTNKQQHWPCGRELQAHMLTRGAGCPSESHRKALLQPHYDLAWSLGAIRTKSSTCCA